MTKFLEAVRWVAPGVGLYLALWLGQDAMEQFSWLCGFTVAPIAGLTALESLFWGQRAAGESGYGAGGRGYQRQSAFNNLAMALTCLPVYLLHWGVYAQAALTTVFLTFFGLSALNHLYSAVRERNFTFRNLARPVLSAALLALVLPFLWAALVQAAGS
ncbi:MAG: hypothetical protein KQJ78_10070 [Deltaproteobacteria bacterium]|nr:hypothetical protein [Deltaproteobacteria bacterium]